MLLVGLTNIISLSLFSYAAKDMLVVRLKNSFVLCFCFFFPFVFNLVTGFHGFFTPMEVLFKCMSESRAIYAFLMDTSCFLYKEI